MPTDLPARRVTDADRGCAYLVVASAFGVLMWGALVFVTVLAYRFAMAV